MCYFVYGILTIIRGFPHVWINAIRKKMYFFKWYGFCCLIFFFLKFTFEYFNWLQSNSEIAYNLFSKNISVIENYKIFFQYQLKIAIKQTTLLMVVYEVIFEYLFKNCAHFIAVQNTDIDFESCTMIWLLLLIIIEWYLFKWRLKERLCAH